MKEGRIKFTIEVDIEFLEKIFRCLNEHEPQIANELAKSFKPEIDKFF